MVLELEGDITETPIQTIAHGVNCQGVMGSGVARALFEKWPKVRESYLEYHLKQSKRGFLDKHFLGTNHYVYIKDVELKQIEKGDYDYYRGLCDTPYQHKTIVNMHTQLNFGSGDKQYIDYAALLNCFNELNSDFIPVIAVPWIGAGLAGGDWFIIKKIMVEATQKKGIDLVIYSLPKKK